MFCLSCFCCFSLRFIFHLCSHDYSYFLRTRLRQCGRRKQSRALVLYDPVHIVFVQPGKYRTWLLYWQIIQTDGKLQPTFTFLVNQPPLVFVTDTVLHWETCWQGLYCGPHALLCQWAFGSVWWRAEKVNLTLFILCLCMQVHQASRPISQPRKIVYLLWNSVSLLWNENYLTNVTGALWCKTD